MDDKARDFHFAMLEAAKQRMIFLVHNGALDGDAAKLAEIAEIERALSELMDFWNGVAVRYKDGDKLSKADRERVVKLVQTLSFLVMGVENEMPL